MKFVATHVITTQADKARTNGVIHVLTIGTKVEWRKSLPNGMILVVSEKGAIQAVRLSDLRLTTTLENWLG